MRAWLYDTPQQSPDVWMMLALAAERTSRIGLGPGVLVPTLRHPMVNAAGTAALAALAPGRVAVAFGTGFTGRRAMGYRAIRWSYLDAYVRAAAGPGLALAFHAAYELNAPLSDLAGGEQWQTVVDRTPPRERHLAVHEQHCVGLNEADRAAWDAGAHALLGHLTVSGSADQVRRRLADLNAQGVTELVYQPCGPDIRRELEVFMQTAKTAVPG